MLVTGKLQRAEQDYGTIISQGHLCLQHPKVIRHVGFGLGTHLLCRPLDRTVNFLGEIHFGMYDRV